MSKKYITVSLLVLIMTTNLFSTTLENLPERYFKYIYQVGKGCVELGGLYNQRSSKANVLRTVKNAKTIEIAKGFARFSFESPQGKGHLILVSDMPACYGLNSYFSKKR